MTKSFNYLKPTKKDRYFLIKDLNCIVIVNFITRKNMLEYIDEYIDNLKQGFKSDDDVFDILYKDGKIDRIDSEFDGHKIRKINIASITWTNPCTSEVYGNFEINEYGVVTPAFEEEVATENIEEVATENIKEIKPIEKEKEEEKEIISNITNIKKPANIKLNHFTVNLINSNKKLNNKTIKKLIANILKEFVINETKFHYIKFNRDGTGVVKSNNGFIWLDFFEYDNKGNLKFMLDDSIIIR